MENGFFLDGVHMDRARFAVDQRIEFSPDIGPYATVAPSAFWNAAVSRAEMAFNKVHGRIPYLPSWSESPIFSNFSLMACVCDGSDDNASGEGGTSAVCPGSDCLAVVTLCVMITPTRRVALMMKVIKILSFVVMVKGS